MFKWKGILLKQLVLERRRYLTFMRFYGDEEKLLEELIVKTSETEDVFVFKKYEREIILSKALPQLFGWLDIPIRRFPLREPSSGDTHGHPCSLHPKRAEQNGLHINLPFMSHFLFSYSHCTSYSLRMQGGNDRFYSHWSLVSRFWNGTDTHNDVPQIYLWKYVLKY